MLRDGFSLRACVQLIVRSGLAIRAGELPDIDREPFGKSDDCPTRNKLGGGRSPCRRVTNGEAELRIRVCRPLLGLCCCLPGCGRDACVRRFRSGRSYGRYRCARIGDTMLPVYVRDPSNSSARNYDNDARDRVSATRCHTGNIATRQTKTTALDGRLSHIPSGWLPYAVARFIAATSRDFLRAAAFALMTPRLAALSMALNASERSFSVSFPFVATALLTAFVASFIAFLRRRLNTCFRRDARCAFFAPFVIAM